MKALTRLPLALALFAACAFAQEPDALPDYHPKRQVSGTIRSWGNPHMAGVLQRWQEGFRRYQPQVIFTDTLYSTATAQFGLQEWVADLAVMGRQMWAYETYGTYRRSLLSPVEVAVTTGSFDTPHQSAALVVFVHKDNPISRLTLRQLDGIFGAERTGGWQGLEWHTEVARAAAGNIHTWGQLGLTGEWAGRPVHPYGPAGQAPGGLSFFQTRVLGGADTVSEGLREYPEPKSRMAALERDPCGIAYAGYRDRTGGVKALDLAETAAGPYLALSPQSVAARTYPLTRTTYVYFTIDTKTGDRRVPRMDPKVEEFLRYILSRQGQADVRQAGGYLPLTPEMVREQWKKIE